MKVVMKMDKPLEKRNDWNKKGFSFTREVSSNNAIDFLLYEGEKKLASFSLYMESCNAVANLTRLNLHDKSTAPQVLLEFFLNYLYHLENPYFKILGLQCAYESSNMNEFLLRSVGFFQVRYGFGNPWYYHLHPNFLEELHMGTQNEEIKSIFCEMYAKYISCREKFITDWQQDIKRNKIFLNELETEGKNEVVQQSQRQWIEINERAINALEEKTFHR